VPTYQELDREIWQEIERARTTAPEEISGMLVDQLEKAHAAVVNCRRIVDNWTKAEA